MSRSYRHNYFLKDSNSGVKKQFNRKLRRAGNKVRFNLLDEYIDDLYDFELPSYGAYKKANESWDICEFAVAYYNYRSYRKNNLQWLGNDENKCYRNWRKDWCMK